MTPRFAARGRTPTDWRALEAGEAVDAGALRPKRPEPLLEVIE